MKRYTILIIAALPVETKAIQSVCKRKFSGITCKFLTCWVGNYNAIFETTTYLQTHQDIDFILNVWVCGKKDNTSSDEMFQVYRIKHLFSLKESLCPLYIDIWNLQSIGSSEKVITSPDDMWEEIYVDMESYGIDYVSKKMRLPYAIIKFPFDSVSPESHKVDTDSIKQLLESYDYESLFSRVYTWCQKNIASQPHWEVYKKQFWFSVAQMHIFQKQYRKLQAFWVDPISFIEKNKDVDRDTFLQKIIEVQDER